MTTLIFLKASENPEDGYSLNDAQCLNGLSFPSYESFFKHYPEEDNSEGDPKILTKSADDFVEEFNDSNFDEELMENYYLAIIEIG